MTMQLLLMRHAKSDWDASYGADHERPLGERGVRSANIMGRLLTAVDEAPDLVITSSANRAATTARLAAEAGGWDCPIVDERRIYGASPATVMQVVAKHGGDARRVMVVGHEPTWSTLVTDLVGAGVEMKTASVAGVGLLIDDWSSLEHANGWLDYLLHPRMFFDTQFDS
jgi:phosphohistidine phosphatase